jgi:hypothetical protein
MKTHVSFLHIIAVGVFLSLSAPWIHAQAPFVSKSHGISATVPKGWDQIEGVRGSTVLKLARVSSEGAKARIAIVADPIPASHPLAGSLDIWDVSDDDIKAASEGTSILGEKITVLDIGRSAIDGYHFVWSKAARPAPDGTLVYEFVYEGPVAGRYFTIRLTAMGSEDWLAANQPDFASLVRSLRFSRPQSSTGMNQEIQPESLRMRSQASDGGYNVVVTEKGDSFWTALGKSIVENFLKVLGAIVLISLIGAGWKALKKK